MKLLLIVLILCCGVGCFSPLKTFLGITKKEEKAEQKIDKNKEETIDKAKTYIHGTGTALQLDPNPSRYSEVANDLNKRASTIVGPPSYQDSLVIDDIVKGLVSTNEQIKAEAQKALSLKDKEVISLQNKLKELEGKLEVIQKKKDEISLQNSQYAETWAKIKRWFKVIVWTIVISVGLMLLSQLLSIILPPPYSSVFAVVGLILGGIGKLVFKIVPSAKRFSGSIDIEDHQKSERTLKHLVQGLQTVRHKEIKPEDIAPQTTNPKIKDLIDDVLLAVTDKESREKIIEKKKELELI